MLTPLKLFSKGECQWRCSSSWTPNRSIRMQNSCHSVVWLETNGSKARCGSFMYRWWNGYCHVCGKVMTVGKTSCEEHSHQTFLILGTWWGHWRNILCSGFEYKSTSILSWMPSSDWLCYRNSLSIQWKIPVVSSVTVYPLWQNVRV